MAALDRAVALEEVDHLPVPIGEDLHLDVARALEVALDQHPVVAEGGLRLAPRHLQGLREAGRVLDDAHALAAAARRSLDQHGIADAPRLARQQR